MAEVTWKNADAGRIPECLGEGVALVLDLENRGVLEQIGERFRIRREGGYCGFDAVLFFLLYFSSSVGIGLRKFWDTVRSCKRKVAAVAGRKQLASPASVSRALTAVEPGLLRPAAEWLLSEGAGIDEVLRHPAVQTYDTRGEGWHVFDFDPTVTTLRHRALPEGEDLPVTRRRSVRTAAPGYSGRKRGDVQFCRGTLQHAGSSAWLQVMLGPGNGDARAELDAALDVVVRTCQRLEHPLARALLRMDGAFGWVPYLSACRAQGVPLMTRLTRPEMFEQPEVLRRLREGTWLLVPDSLSGPRRSALDLGLVTLPPGHDTRQEDGTPYAPVTVRVVVSRYPRAEKAEHGRLIDGWQYEMFVVDVPAEALPAPDAVAQYFGRAGQENRFAQEDREAGLDRIFSYHLPGQELAVVVGLWVWNLRLVRGFELAPPPVARPAQEPHAAKVDDRLPVAAPEVPPDLPPGHDLPGEPAQGSDGESGPSVTAETIVTSRVSMPDPGVDEILEALRRIDWSEALRNHPGWSFDAATGYLRCKDGRELGLTTVRKGEHAPDRTNIIFCRPVGGCASCQPRSGCMRSAELRSAKHIELSVPTSVAARLRELLRARRRTRQECKPHPPQKRPRTSFPLSPLTPALALLTVLPSLFLPAVARSILRTAASALVVSVTVTAAPLRPRPVLLAESVAHKQHRRKTWKQNLERYALDHDTAVSVELAGSEALRRLLSACHTEAVK